MKNYTYKNYLHLILILFEYLFGILIIKSISYTEIDYSTYLQHVHLFQSGERNYSEIKGWTGSLVYPAGFLYFYSFLKRISNQSIVTTQYIFLFLYIVTQIIIFKLYYQSKIPLISLILLTLSKRIHSIYLLRLFNDVPAMLFTYISIYFLAQCKYKLGCIFYTVAVSIKMNVLLFAPGLAFLLVHFCPWYECVLCIFICGILQVGIAWPFLRVFPVEYVTKAFEFNRIFEYKWSVNWKLLSETTFVSFKFSIFLLTMHLLTLILFSFKLRKYLKQYKDNPKENKKISPNFITYTLLLSNYIGVVFCKTLHYQFYSWYFHSFPYLLYQTTIPASWKLCIMVGLEYSYWIFPATYRSSFLLQIIHVGLLLGLAFGKIPKVYAVEEKVVQMHIKMKKS